MYLASLFPNPDTGKKIPFTTSPKELGAKSLY